MVRNGYYILTQVHRKSVIKTFFFSYLRVIGRDVLGSREKFVLRYKSEK